MKLQFSRFRTLLLTFTLGLTVAGIYTKISEYSEEIPVNLPQVESNTPFIIRLCPEIFTDGQKSKVYQENGYNYFSKEKAMNCTISLGAAGGGGA